MAGVLVAGFGMPASAAAKPVVLSARLSGSTVIVNVNGVKHSCVAKPVRLNGEVFAACSNGTGFTYQPTMLSNGSTVHTLTAMVGRSAAYRCVNPRVRPSQWTCNAQRVR